MFYNFDPVPVNCAYTPVTETIPQTKLGYSTNNIYPGFPPLMSDGRSIYASYQPQAEWNEEILNRNGIQTNWQYRQYLTNNANEIMYQNFQEAANDVGYFKRYTNEIVPSSTHLANPYMVYDSLEGGSSDLKRDYLSREELNQRIGYITK